MGDPFQQLHDWEPGIAASQLFWTIPISPSAIIVNPDKGTATLRARNVAIPDFHDFFNAISPNPSSVPSHVSFDVHWNGGASPTALSDSTFDFSGTFVEGPATIDFTARNDNAAVIYRSDPTGQTSQGAGVGRERNGAFFG